MKFSSSHPPLFIAALISLNGVGCSSNVHAVQTDQICNEDANLSTKIGYTKMRGVTVPIMGNVKDLCGVQWTVDPESYALSYYIEENCAVNVRLFNGKVLSMNSRPVLIISRIYHTDIIGSVEAPVGNTHASLPNAAQEVERLLSSWGIVPSSQMREELELWKKSGSDNGAGIGGRMRAAMNLDSSTWIGFRVDSGGPGVGGWNLVAEIQAQADKQTAELQQSMSRASLHDHH